MKKVILHTIAAFASFISITNAQTITTIAGTGFRSFGGDGGAATAARLDFPGQPAIDTNGNVFIPDYGNNRIRKVTPSGVITTIAGSGASGYVASGSFSGDGGPASAAQFYAPNSLAIDKRGNLFVSDAGNARIRKIDASGTVSTIAGTGSFTISGDGGPATDAGIGSARSIATDKNGSVIFSDDINSLIRKIDTNGIITTIAGTGTGGYSGDGGPATAADLNSPQQVATDTSGNVYIADGINNRIRKISPAGIITTVAGTGTGAFSGDGGQATDAELSGAPGVTADNQGNIYICDYDNKRIRKVAASGIINTIAGNGVSVYSGDGGPATAAGIYIPQSIVTDKHHNLYLSFAEGVDGIRKIDSAGVISNFAGCGTSGLGDGGPASSAQIDHPSAIVTDITGNMYVSEYLGNTIRKIDTAGGIITIAGNRKIGFSGDGGAATQAQIYLPYDVAVDFAGNFYVSDPYNFTVRKISGAGVITRVAGNGTAGYTGDGGPATAASIVFNSHLAVDRYGNIYICGGRSYRIRKINSSGIISTIAGTGSLGFSGDGGAATAAQLGFTEGITADLYGNIYFTDGDRIRKIDTSGVIHTIAGTGTWGYTGDGAAATLAQIATPMGIFVDPGNNVYFSSVASQVVRRINSSGIITTVAGNGSFGFSGDGGPATVASLFSPHGLTADASGNIYFADMNNDRIRKISSCAPAVGAITGPDSACASATISLADSTTGGVWLSLDSTIARISSSGVVTGMAPGNTTIYYIVSNSCGSAYKTKTVYVGQHPASGTITGASAFCLTSTTTLSDTSSGGTWRSGNPSVATVSASGVVTGLTSGSDTIFYSVTNGCGSASSWFVIRVDSTPNAGTISGASSLCASATTTLTTSGTGGSWTSGATGIATVNTSGMVVGVSGGSVTISYAVSNSCGSAVATHTMSVSPLPSAGTISGPASLCPGATISLSASVAGGTWSSGVAGNATVSSSGVVMGVTAGIDTIFYSVTNSCGTVMAIHPVNVIPTPVAGSITGASVACVGTSLSLSTTGLSGGTWYSTAPGVASITTGGGVLTCIATGTTIITYTITNSCGTSTTSDTVTVNALPVVGTITGSVPACPGLTRTLADTTAGGVWSGGATGIASVDTSGNVTAIGVGTTIITYTVTNICGSTSALVAFVVNNPPSAGVITGPVTVCQGATVTLGETVTSGFWTSSNNAIATIDASGTVTGVAVGVDTIFYSVTSTCGGVAVGRTITVNPAPVAGTISGSSNVCITTSIPFSATVSGGTWTTSNIFVATVSTTGVVTGSGFGTCSIYYTVTNSCGSASVGSSVTVVPIAVCIAGVAETNPQPDNLSIYPNPTDGITTLRLSSAYDEAIIIRVTNVTGQVVASFTGSTNKPAEMQLQQPAGVYFVTVLTGHRRYTERVVVSPK